MYIKLITHTHTHKTLCKNVKNILIYIL